MIQGLRFGLLAGGLSLAACGDDVLREENLERLRLLQLEFVWVEPGSFTMGTNGAQERILRQRGMWDELARAEQPAREVVLERGFYLGKYEITQAQWTGAMGTWPWVAQEHVEIGEGRPAVYVSWRDAQDFVRRLNEWAGVGEDEAAVYRLPTEAEWEYACRAGSERLWFFGDDMEVLGEYAWYKDNTWDEGMEYAQPVGGKKANAWGLHDMYGNVWEWCADWGASPDGSGFKPILRGGSFFNGAANVRSALKIRNEARFKFSDIGLRVVKEKE